MQRSTRTHTHTHVQHSPGHAWVCTNRGRLSLSGMSVYRGRRRALEIWREMWDRAAWQRWCPMISLLTNFTSSCCHIQALKRAAAVLRGEKIALLWHKPMKKCSVIQTFWHCDRWFVLKPLNQLVCICSIVLSFITYNTVKSRPDRSVHDVLFLLSWWRALCQKECRLTGLQEWWCSDQHNVYSEMSMFLILGYWLWQLTFPILTGREWKQPFLLMCMCVWSVRVCDQWSFIVNTYKCMCFVLKT